MLFLCHSVEEIKSTSVNCFPSPSRQFAWGTALGVMKECEGTKWGGPSGGCDWWLSSPLGSGLQRKTSLVGRGLLRRPSGVRQRAVVRGVASGLCRGFPGGLVMGGAVLRGGQEALASPYMLFHLPGHPVP